MYIMHTIHIHVHDLRAAWLYVHTGICTCMYYLYTLFTCYAEKELSQQISRIRGNVRGFQKMLADMKPGPACEWSCLSHLFLRVSRASEVSPCN